MKERVIISLVLRQESVKSNQNRFMAEVTIPMKHGFIRAEERAVSPNAAIDIAQEVIIRQIRRIKTRKQRGRNIGKLAQIVEDIENSQEKDSIDLPFGKVVRVKKHRVEPMTIEGATAQMDLLGHNFFVFVLDGTDEINVVYRRHDGDYGLITPTT